MSQCLEIEFGWKNWQNLQGPKWYAIAESIGKDADTVSTDDRKNEFDAWGNKS